MIKLEIKACHNSSKNSFTKILNIENGKTLFFGRSEKDVDVFLDDIKVSRKHARIELQNNNLMLIDSSSNGTSVDLKKISEIELNDNSEIVMGNFTIHVSILEKINDEWHNALSLIGFIKILIDSFKGLATYKNAYFRKQNLNGSIKNSIFIIFALSFIHLLLPETKDNLEQDMFFYIITLFYSVGKYLVISYVFEYFSKYQMYEYCRIFAHYEIIRFFINTPIKILSISGSTIMPSILSLFSITITIWFYINFIKIFNLKPLKLLLISLINLVMFGSYILFLEDKVNTSPEQRKKMDDSKSRLKKAFKEFRNVKEPE